MDLCGKVYVSKDLCEFSLKCSKCEENLTEWLDFVIHVGNCLLSDIADEPYIDVPSETKLDEKLGVFEINQPTQIKLEEGGLQDCSLEQLNESLYANTNVNESVKYELDVETKEEVADANIFSGEEDNDEDDNFDGDECFSGGSSSDESFTIKKKRKKGTRSNSSRFNPSFYRQDRYTPFFIELYKGHPCLWDEKHVNFKDEETRKLAYKSMIKSIKKEFQINLKESTLKDRITKMRQQYYTVQESLKEDKNKITKPVFEYYKSCSYLGEIYESIKENVVETRFKIRCQVFSSLEKDAIDAMIKLYEKNSVLYNKDHAEYHSNLKRSAALNSIAETLEQDFKVSVTAERLSNLIRSLRDWYYKIAEIQRSGKSVSEEEQYYLQLCSFIPPKVKKQRFECNLCPNVYSSDKTFQLHMVEVHKIGEMPHKCEECNRFFRQRSSLILHNQRSHSDKKLQCEYCNRKFSVLADFRLHIRTHTEEKPYVCDQCGKAFRVRTQLGYHVTAIHTKVRAFKCNICPKDFLKAVHLRDHIKSHLNIRDKICETCGKGFTNCHSLIRHRQIHSAVKKFECKLCDAKFHQFVGLNSHMKRTHNIVKNKPKIE